jgi:hypothetical protein
MDYLLHSEIILTDEQEGNRPSSYEQKGTGKKLNHSLFTVISRKSTNDFLQIRVTLTCASGGKVLLVHCMSSRVTLSYCNIATIS